jgi:gluconate 2-dehydrogenase alpha chain
MVTKLPPVDILIVGMGWTGGILANELGPTGLKIAVLDAAERVRPRTISAFR